MQLFLDCFLLFFIYSVFGWLVESTYVSIKENKLVDRGFLIGPYCPIYGFGCLGMIFYLEQYKDNILTVFILGVVICSILEYFTSYIMEVLFNTRWWDYSNRKFNLNGRICGANSILFGLGGVFIVYIVHPLFSGCLNYSNEAILNIITIVCLIIFLGDTIISLNVVNRFKRTVTNIEAKKDSSEEFSNMVRKTIREKNMIFQSRLLSAFPNIDFKKFEELKEDIKEEIREFLKK